MLSVTISIVVVFNNKNIVFITNNISKQLTISSMTWNASAYFLSINVLRNIDWAPL